MKKGPRIVALQDISKYLIESNGKIIDKNRDVWIVTAYRLDNIEQRRLNNELGLRNINYTKDAMTRK